MRYLHLVIALAAPLVSASACRPPKWIVGQTVQTSSGAVEGHAASTATEVSEYLGIPYAQPPVGSLRFQPPVRYSGKSKISGKNFVSASLWTWGSDRADSDNPGRRLFSIQH